MEHAHLPGETSPLTHPPSGRVPSTDQFFHFLLCLSRSLKVSPRNSISSILLKICTWQSTVYPVCYRGPGNVHTWPILKCSCMTHDIFHPGKHTCRHATEVSITVFVSTSRQNQHNSTITRWIRLLVTKSCPRCLNSVLSNSQTNFSLEPNHDCRQKAFLIHKLTIHLPPTLNFVCKTNPHGANNGTRRMPGPGHN